MLKLRDISKTYATENGHYIHALDGISIDFVDTGLVFIIGKSGSGKSTILNIIGGLDTADSGDMEIKGLNSKDFTAPDFDNYRNTEIGFVFQEYNLIENYSVGANIGLALELQGKRADKSEVEAVMRRVDLVDEQNKTLYDRQINELSGGQKQRVAIARAIIKNPDIILADEPTGALDSDTGNRLYELLKQLSWDKLIIVVSHDLESAKAYGDRIIELQDGRIVNDSGTYGLSDKPIDSGAFLKSRLPLKRIVTMGLNGLTVKKFRLTVSILLSVITFVILGFALTAVFTDPLGTELSQMYQDNQHMIVVYNNNARSDNMDSMISFTESQLQKIDDYSDGQKVFIHSANYSVARVVNVQMSYHIGVKNHYSLSNSTYGRYESAASKIGGLVELEDTMTAEDVFLRPDDRLLDKSRNRLPQNYNEIAITDMHADVFIRYGFIERRDKNGVMDKEKLIPITTPDDLIGKTLGRWNEETEEWIDHPFTIVGVYATEQDREIIKETLNDPDYKGASNLYSDYVTGMTSSAENSMISYGFVKKGMFEYILDTYNRHDNVYEWNRNASFLLKLSGDYGRDKSFLNSLNISENGKSYRAKISTPYSGFVANTEYMMIWMVRVGVVAAIIFAVFAVLLMISFLNVSIDSKTKEIGILRAMGARKSDVTKICLIESLVIMTVQFILAIVCCLILCSVLNAVLFHLPILQFGIIQVALVLLLSLAVTAAATIFPVLRISKRKPVDIINQKI